MTPEQAHFLLHEVYVPQIKHEHKTTRRVIESVPAGRLDYSPDPVSMNAWKLATHLASSEIFFMTGAANGEFNPKDAEIPESVKTPAELAKWYEDCHAKALAKLAGTHQDGLLKTVPFAGAYNYPAINYIGLMITHSVHHRGQLSAYLRPMGAKVPGIYGPSADEPTPAQQKAAH